MEARNEALKEFIPAEGMDTFIANKNYIEKDFGFLLMIDLRKSTLLSNKFGKEKWIEITNGIRKEVDSVLVDSQIKLQEFVWDAFYFTLTCSSENNNFYLIEEFIVNCKNNNRASVRF